MTDHRGEAPPEREPGNGVTRASGPRRRLDDAAIAGLIRTAASAWQMPPRRLGMASWRERVGEPGPAAGAGRTALPRGAWPIGLGTWRRRIAAAGSTAIAATVVVALVAVWLSTPRSRPPVAASGSGLSSAASGSAHPSLKSSDSPTPAPTLVAGVQRFGGPLPPTRVVMWLGDGTSIVDPEGSNPSVQIAPASPFSQVFATKDGTVVCACTSSTIDQTTDTVKVTVRRFDKNGRQLDGSVVRTYVGLAGSAVVPAGDGAATTATLSPDEKRLFIGWTIRRADGWRTGIDAVDLATGDASTVATLPDLPLNGSPDSGPAASPSAGVQGLLTVSAPTIRISPDGSRLVAAQHGSVFEVPFPSRRFGAPLAGLAVGRLIAFPSGAGTLAADDCLYTGDEGFATPNIYEALCTDNSSFHLRLVDATTGHPVRDLDLTELNAGSVLFSGSRIVDHARGVGYLWSIFSRRLVKTDLATGRVLAETTIAAPTAAADPLTRLAAAIGSWLAPEAAAKVYVSPSFALAPDGTRLYLLGTTATSPLEPEGAGSTGVTVIDTSSLGVVANWPATADFNSIAVSSDGRWVYAAGLPDVAADGTAVANEASITVYDAATGQPRVVRADLGRDWLTIVGVATP